MSEETKQLDSKTDEDLIECVECGLSLTNCYCNIEDELHCGDDGDEFDE